MRTEITKSHLNNHISQHRGMKTSTVTPTFYYVFNNSLYCNDTIPSFIGNLWRLLLPGNHLKPNIENTSKCGFSPDLEGGGRGGGEWRRSEHAHASYPGLFFRPLGFSPYMGREKRRVQGLAYSIDGSSVVITRIARVVIPRLLSTF